MREILFRGKTYKGKWVVGSLIIDERGNHYIGEYIKQRVESVYCCTKRSGGKIANRFIGIGFVMVSPETVCQCTGLTDKNGKRIFEGDILKGEQYPYKDFDGDYNYLKLRDAEAAYILFRPY